MATETQIAIVGSGPAGLAAGARAAINNISHLILESAPHMADTTFKYQKGKQVMATPMALPLRCDLGFNAGSRESVLEQWRNACEQVAVAMRLQSEVAAITHRAGSALAFELHFTNGTAVHAEQVILAIGMQGNLRKLDIPGAAQDPRVQYQLDDPDEYRGETIVVVGAGDAAIENALALSAGNNVIIVNRRDEFARAKLGNLQAISKAIENGQVECYYQSSPIALEDTGLRLMTAKGEATVHCDRVVARLGAEPPRKLLESFGIEFTSPASNALPVLDEHYQTSVPGLYVIGALSGSPLIKQAMNQGYEVVEYIRGNTNLLPADESLLAQKLKPLAKHAQESDAGAGADELIVSDLLRFIQSHTPLLNELNPLLMRELMLESEAREVAANATIFKRNDYSSSFFSIISGSVVIDAGLEQPLSLEAGEYFGEMGLISGRRRSADAYAGAEGATVIETNRRAMVKLLNTEPQVKRVLDQTTVTRHIQTFLAPHLTKAELTPVSDAASIEAHGLGESLFEEGEPGDDLLLIRKGSVTVSKRIGMREVVLGYVAAGNYVGEMALVSQNARSASVRSAANGTEIIRIPSSALKTLLDRSPRLRSEVEQKYRDRIRRNESLDTQPEASNVIEFLLQQGLGEATDVLIIDESLCVRCDQCEVACAATHQGVSRLDREAGPRFANLHVPTSCRHCEHPYCMSDCPPDAIHRSPAGEVFVSDACIGCGNCVRNCPYGVIQLANLKRDRNGNSLAELLQAARNFFLSPRSPSSANAASSSQDAGLDGESKLAVKCDMCAGLASGPACVLACPTGAAARVKPEAFFQLVTGETQVQ